MQRAVDERLAGKPATRQQHGGGQCKRQRAGHRNQRYAQAQQESLGFDFRQHAKSLFGPFTTTEYHERR